MKSHSYFLLFLIFVLTSCSIGSKVSERNSFSRSKKIPEANIAFIAMSKNVISNAKLLKKEVVIDDNNANELKTNNSKEFTEKNIMKNSPNKPRQNIFIRQAENSFVSDFDTTNNKVSSSRYSFSEIMKSKESNSDDSFMSNKVEKQSSADTSFKSVIIGVYDSEKDAINNAIAATSYIGRKFSVFKDMDKFTVKTNSSMEKKDAYKVAHLGLKLGYYESRVVY